MAAVSPIIDSNLKFMCYVLPVYVCSERYRADMDILRISIATIVDLIMHHHNKWLYFNHFSIIVISTFLVANPT